MFIFMRLSVVVPCYNEKDNLPFFLEEFKKSIGNRLDVEVVLVDNGSNDGTGEFLEDNFSNYPFLKIVRVEFNQGYGFGILSGLKVSTGEYLGWTHGDAQTPSKDVLKALKIIEDSDYKEKIYVKGKREGRKLFDILFTVGMSFFESVFLGQYLNDINAQPNIFHRSFFEQWVDPPYDFSLDLYVFYLARKLNLKVVRFPVNFIPRIHGVSHWNSSLSNKWKYIRRTIKFSFKLKKESLNL